MASKAASATILDVARIAKVSRQTVTRALNGLPDVSDATRDRVIAAARELNYRPNRAAQSLVRGRGITVGLVVEDLRNPYFPELASALSRIAAERGWSVILCDIGDDENKARERLGSMVQRVDALVLTGCRTDTVSLLPPEVLRGNAIGLPIVMLDGTPGEHIDALVEIDHETGVRAALDHLTATGRRRIAMIDSIYATPARREAYRAYLAEHRLEWSDRSEVRADETHTGGIGASRELLAGYPDADAVLVYNDVMAVGALKGFAQAGVPVPERIAVIGTDGLALGSLVTPELTSLSIDKTELAQHAVELVDDILSGRAGAEHPQRRRLALTLVARKSG